MIILTREAVTAVHGAIDRAGKPGFGLRLSAESNGCAGPRYAMSLEDEPQADDVVVEIRDLRVFVDPEFDDASGWNHSGAFHPPSKEPASLSTTLTLELPMWRISARSITALAANHADRCAARPFAMALRGRGRIEPRRQSRPALGTNPRKSVVPHRAARSVARLFSGVGEVPRRGGCSPPFPDIVPATRSARLTAKPAPPSPYIRGNSSPNPNCRW